MRAIDADALKEDLTRFYDNEVTARKLIDEQPTIHPEPHWIPVTERLPEKFDYYLVSGNNSVWFARYENGRFLGVLSGHALDTVIAWMPLPEPYKGVTE